MALRSGRAAKVPTAKAVGWVWLLNIPSLPTSQNCQTLFL
jgi:hypothetical protein